MILYIYNNLFFLDLSFFNGILQHVVAKFQNLRFKWLENVQHSIVLIENQKIEGTIEYLVSESEIYLI